MHYGRIEHPATSARLANRQLSPSQNFETSITWGVRGASFVFERSFKDWRGREEQTREQILQQKRRLQVYSS